MVFTYSVADAGLSAAQVLARGSNPHLFAEPTHSFLMANPWMEKVPNSGPAGETEILEQELEKAVLHLGFTNAPLDATDSPMPLLGYALKADALEKLWARAVNGRWPTVLTCRRRSRLRESYTNPWRSSPPGLWQAARSPTPIIIWSIPIGMSWTHHRLCRLVTTG